MHKKNLPAALPREDQRSQSIRAACTEIVGWSAPLQQRGFYGQLKLELELQDGIVKVVRAGVEEVLKVHLGARAA